MAVKIVELDGPPMAIAPGDFRRSQFPKFSKGGVVCMLDFVPQPTPGLGYLASVYPDQIPRENGAPVQARIRILYRADPTKPFRDGALVAEVLTSVSGEWRVDNLNTAYKYDIVCRLPGYNDMILANASPTPY